MKTWISLTILLSFFMTALGQTLPKASPLGTSEQLVGVTTIGLEYSRPGVKDRVIFGELLPFGELWRLGANSCTKFSCSTPIEIQGQTLAAGTYALFATPLNDTTWTVAFNTDIEQGGTRNYDSTKNVISYRAKAKPNSFTETLTLEINDIRESSAALVIKWENTRVDIPFTLKTEALAIDNIKTAIALGENLDEVYLNAAKYYHSSLNKGDIAMEYVSKSLKLKESYGALFLKAQLLQAKGKTKEAIVLAEKAQAQAITDGSHGYASFMGSQITEWKK